MSDCLAVSLIGYLFQWCILCLYLACLLLTCFTGPLVECCLVVAVSYIRSSAGRKSCHSVAPHHGG